MNGVTSQVDSAAAKPTNSLRTLLILLLLPCLASSIFAMRDADSPPLNVRSDRPALVFKSYMVHEGPDPIESQPLITPFFVFKNKGTETVRITELKAMCSCMQPVATPVEVPPGVEGRLTLPIRTNNEAAGPHEYLVTVKYEDPKPRELTLTYKVVLPAKQIEIEPRVVMVMGRAMSKERSVVMISDQRPERRDSPMKITGVVSSSSLFSVAEAGHSDVDGVRRTAIEVTFSKDIPMGQHRGVITVSTDDPIYPALQIPVILGDRKRPDDEQVFVNPESGRVIVDTIEPKQSSGTSVAFSIPPKWKFSHVDAFPPQVLANVVKTIPGEAGNTEISVQLSLTEIPARGVEKGSLTLHATDGEAPEMITVPISLVWRTR